MIEIELEYFQNVNYALIHNKIPVNRYVEVRNNTKDTFTDVSVSIEGEFIAGQGSLVIAQLQPGQVIRIETLKIEPNPEKLVTLTERLQTTFKVVVRTDAQQLAAKEYPLELMPFDHWLGSATLPQTLASFVTPNHPEINKVVVRAAAMLKELTGESNLTEYQTNNPNDVRMQVAAVFAALHAAEIVYRSAPPSFEESGQRITMPDRVLQSKLGNCLELTLLMASVLECIGINSCIVLQKGHAYLAVWLVKDSYQQSICDDASYLEKKCSNGINEMMVVECTHITHENASFEKAVKAAEHNLALLDQFECFIDVQRCRLENFLPLPVMVQENGAWRIVDGVEHGTCTVGVSDRDRFDLSQLDRLDRERSRFDIWDRKLLDFTLRNSLLNINLAHRAIQFLSFDVNLIEDQLQQGDEFCLQPMIEMPDKVETEERLFRSKLLEPYHELILEDIRHKQLHSYLSEVESRNVLKKIYRVARNAVEETGANPLFLAIGALRWYETPQSQEPRFAPILLLPVEMVYKKGHYYIRTREEEITLNVTLVEYLKQIHDINIPSLNVLPKDDSGVDVPLIFTILRETLKDQARWDVEEECILGIFSFSKFLMWHDVHYHREELLQNDIINSLVQNHLTWSPEPIVSDLRPYDRESSPVETALPVPADSSQMAAILEGGKGHSFILYGPPGTGKSQTITNLIANALFQGKHVLFVAEKMAALSVVQTRLEKIGLAPFCLELHSNKATKSRVLEKLEQTLNVTHHKSPGNYKSVAEKIREERSALIDYMCALHDEHEDHLSLYDCFQGYECIDADPLDGMEFTPELLELISQHGIGVIHELLGSELETLLKLVGQPSQHPLNGLLLKEEDIISPEGCVHRLKRATEILEQGEDDREKLKGIAELRARLIRDNREDILELDASQLHDEWRSIKAKWFLPRFISKMAFMERLKSYNKYITEEEVDRLIEDLMAYQEGHGRIIAIHQVLLDYMNIKLDADKMPGTDLVSDIIAHFHRWMSHSGQMRDWLHWSNMSRELREKGLGIIVDMMESQECNVTGLRDSFLKTFYKKKAEEKICASPALRVFEGMLFDERVKRYKLLANDFQALTQRELHVRLASGIPHVTDNIDSSSEIGFLKRCISSKGRGVSLRDLFDQIPTLLPRLCPCMLMSPMSVAQYLNLEGDKFDLVVFDEASQMPTCEAVGAIARGKSLIVVGDPKQMPPTSFFTSMAIDDEEAVLDDMESILEDCKTLEMPSLQLNWHYRSRHESLIAFSNNEYYDGQLITFPSIDDQQTKVRMVHVDGFYDKGKKRTNRNEAEAIVNEIVRRITDEELHGYSIGVIAFSVVQQTLIEDLLLERMDKDAKLKEAADSMYEPIFVKNLENVQGDERDVILFSIGYGPDSQGKVSMNFGPLNNAGGERRLNVAVSRARCEMIVYSTLTAAQIDLRRSNAKGVEGLKHFLEFAETQTLTQTSTSVHPYSESETARQIAAELEARGLHTTTFVGRSQFKVDIAVSDQQNPELYRLGILMDGNGYRDTQTTRDREIVQPSVLANLDWRVMRVWSVDWFNNKERVISRILDFYNQETPEDVDEETEGETEVPANVDVTFEGEGSYQSGELDETSDISICCPYEEYSADAEILAGMGLRELVDAIVAKEQPVTFNLLCRRVCNLQNQTRAIVSVQKSLMPYVADKFYVQKDPDCDVLWVSEEDCNTFTGYRTSSGREIGDIPMAEVRNAVLEAIRQQLSINPDALLLIVARKLGFSRRGTNLDKKIRKCIALLLQEGIIESIDDKVRMA